MIQGSYDKILEKISKFSGIGKEELERRVEAKRAKLSGLISREGAAQIVAAELGINFDNEKLKIEELFVGMKKVKTSGKILNIFPVREYNKNGKSGKVANMIIADDTSNIKVVLWDTNHISLIESGQLKIGDVVDIANASMREMELHLGSFSEIKKSSELFENVKETLVVREKAISGMKNGENARTRAFILQVFEPRFFEVCSECKRKVVKDETGCVCDEHGRVTPEKRVLINVVIDDGSESIRAVLFNESVFSLGIDTSILENPESFAAQKEGLLGKEMFFSGKVRENKVFNNPEFVIDKVEEINLDELIKEMSK